MDTPRFAAVLALACSTVLSMPLASSASASSFIQNAGQQDSDVLFYEEAGGRAAIYFTRDAIVIDRWRDEPMTTVPNQKLSMLDRARERAAPSEMRRQGRVVRISFAGGNASSVRGEGRSPVSLSYYYGSDPAHWRNG